MLAPTSEKQSPQPHLHPSPIPRCFPTSSYLSPAGVHYFSRPLTSTPHSQEPSPRPYHQLAPLPPPGRAPPPGSDPPPKKNSPSAGPFLTAHPVHIGRHGSAGEGAAAAAPGPARAPSGTPGPAALHRLPPPPLSSSPPHARTHSSAGAGRVSTASASSGRPPFPPRASSAQFVLSRARPGQEGQRPRSQSRKQRGLIRKSPKVSRPGMGGRLRLNRLPSHLPGTRKLII